jgi:hypothetical protein
MTTTSLMVRRRVGDRSIKRAIEDWKARIPPTHPASTRGVKRGRASDDEEVEEEDQAERYIGVVQKRYSSELPVILLSGYSDM